MTSSILQHPRATEPSSTGNDAVALSPRNGREKRRAVNTAPSNSTAANASSSENRKLRASCDGCYLAKIKCGKERPRCSRCVTHRTLCQYSPSQRIGKPRRHPLPGSASPVKSNIQVRPAENIRPASPLNHGDQLQQPSSGAHAEGMCSPNDKGVNTPMFEWPFNLTPPTSDTSGSEATLPITPGLSFAWNQALYGSALSHHRPATFDTSSTSPQWPQAHHLANSSDLTLIHGESTSTPTIIDAHAQQPTPLTPSTAIKRPPPPSSPPNRHSMTPLSQTDNHATSTTTVSVDPSLTTVSSKDTTNAPRSDLSPPQTCNHNASAPVSLLQTLSSLPPNPAFDTLLATTKSVLNSLSSLLTCPSPSCPFVNPDAATPDPTSTPELFPTTFFALTTLVSTLLNLYLDSLSHTAPPPPPPTAPSPESHSPHPYAPARSTPPMTLGQYRLTLEDEAVVKASVVRNELRKVDGILVRVGEKVSGLRDGHDVHRDTATIDTSPEADAVCFAQVLGWLKGRVKGVLRKTEGEVGEVRAGEGV